MAILHQYLLSLADCRALGLRDTYSLHRIVYSLFSDVRAGGEGSSGILYADKGSWRQKRRLLILSDRAALRPACGELASRELPAAFFEFPHYRFEIIVNAVRRNAKSGKREPVRGREEAGRWFAEKAPQWGFLSDPAGLQVADITADCFVKDGMPVTLNKARITGTLSVSDKTRFLDSFFRGIGHGKAFGCGLLQLAPLVF